MRIKIEAGNRDDYALLARFHYRAGMPATCCQVLRATARADLGPADSGAGSGLEVVGVLVVSMPVLNAGWRAIAWPDLHASALGRRERSIDLNRRIRTISRVVVDPRFRGTGVARRLVRAYLDRPLTERTEATAAMGASCPFFARAGMREIRWPHAPAIRQLAHRLKRTGVDAVRLADLRYARKVTMRPDVRRALRAWLRSGRQFRGVAGGSWAIRAAAAGARLAAPGRAWVTP